jgi:hypothetical protein
MIRNHPEFVAILAILVTMPCAYLLGSASRQVRTTVSPIHRELRQELQRERDRIRQDILHERDNFKQDLRRETDNFRNERDRMRHELRDGFRRTFRFRSA